ncbi:hypothetical protein CEXT_563511 [Caerostris extrusa]|uniref:Uncharacterized protein n=1 Tax=Caerostris extrusa TaxID=172846 RepID=A0AAV4N0V1_CAEEX|nr:hypothetical protein CEXT_563511 [Caerostris extrusa]
MGANWSPSSCLLSSTPSAIGFPGSPCDSDKKSPRYRTIMTHQLYSIISVVYSPGRHVCLRRGNKRSKVRRIAIGRGCSRAFAEEEERSRRFK